MGANSQKTIYMQTFKLIWAPLSLFPYHPSSPCSHTFAVYIRSLLSPFTYVCYVPPPVPYFTIFPSPLYVSSSPCLHTFAYPLSPIHIRFLTPSPYLHTFTRFPSPYSHVFAMIPLLLYAYICFPPPQFFHFHMFPMFVPPPICICLLAPYPYLYKFTTFPLSPFPCVR